MAESFPESCHALVPYDEEIVPGFVQAKVLQPEDQQSIIAFGVTGHGKSSFLNLILGADKPVFETSSGGILGTASKTKETQCVSFTTKGKRLALIDTPGFCDTKSVADNRDKGATRIVEEEGHKFRVNITKAFIAAGKKVSAFIFVYRIDLRFSLEMTEQLKFLETIKFPWDHCILVMTHGDRAYPHIAKEKWYEAFEAELPRLKEHEQLKGLMRKTTPRYMLVDNTCRDKKYHETVMERFLAFMEQIADRRGPYENIHFTFFSEKYDKVCHSTYMDEIKNHTSLTINILQAVTSDDFKQLALIGCSLVAKQEEFIEKFQGVIDMVGKKTFTPIVAAATGFGVATIAAGVVATVVGTALIPVTFGSSAIAVAVGVGSIVGGTAAAVGGVGAAAGIPLIKKLKDTVEVKKAQRSLDKTIDLVKKFYAQYKSIMKKISGDHIGHVHPNARHSLFAHLVAMHIHKSTVKSEALFENAQELGVFYSLRYKENNPSPESRVLYTLPVGFSLLASNMDVAQTVGTALSATHVSKGAKEIDTTLLRECERVLKKEFNAIKALCITKKL